MALRCRFLVVLFFFLSISSNFALLNATSSSAGDADPIYKACFEECQKSGCVGEKCFKHCNFSSDENPTIDGPWYLQEPLYQRWKHWDCQSECQYHCMLDREEERQKLGLNPVKYHGKWPFQRVYGMQEPVSVALSALNLAIQFHGWISFFLLVNYKLPLRPNKKTYYEYTGLWHIYAILSMNYWLWNTVFHCRDVELIERINTSSGVALIGFSVILAIFRVFNVKIEAARVMISAPIIAFIVTHILYLNFYTFDLRLNTIVCTGMIVVHIILWATWAGITKHPSRRKLWVVVIGGGLAMILDIYDFPPYMKYVDAHAIMHAMAIFLGSLWWSFVLEDSELRTSTLLKKSI